jgi:hypothetical protein
MSDEAGDIARSGKRKAHPSEGEMENELVPFRWMEGGESEERDLTDLTLNVVLRGEGDIKETFLFRVHRALLSSKSGFFNQIIQLNGEKKEINLFLSSSVGDKEFRVLLDYMYDPTSVNITAENCFQVLTASDYFQVEPCSNLALEYIENHLSLSESATCLSHAYKTGKEKVVEIIFNLFCDQWKNEGAPQGCNSFLQEVDIDFWKMVLEKKELGNHKHLSTQLGHFLSKENDEGRLVMADFVKLTSELKQLSKEAAMSLLKTEKSLQPEGHDHALTLSASARLCIKSLTEQWHLLDPNVMDKFSRDCGQVVLSSIQEGVATIIRTLQGTIPNKLVVSFAGERGVHGQYCKSDEFYGELPWYKMEKGTWKGNAVSLAIYFKRADSAWCLAILLGDQPSDRDDILLYDLPIINNGQAWPPQGSWQKKRRGEAIGFCPRVAADW